MDDFLLEQVFPMSWSDMGGVNKASWHFNGGSSGISISTEPADGSSVPYRPITMPMNAFGTPSSSSGLSTGLHCQAPELQESIGRFQGDAVVHYPFDDTSVANELQQHCIQEALDAGKGISAGPSGVWERLLPKGVHESFLSSSSQGMTAEGVLGLQFNSGNPSIADSTASRLLAAVTCRAPGLPRSPSVGSSGSDGPALQQSSPQQLPPQVAAAWQQSYLHGALPPSVDVAQAKAESFPIYDGMPDDPIAQEQIRDRDDAPGASLGVLPVDGNLGGAQAGQQFHQQGGHGSIMPSYGTNTGVAQTQGAVAAMFSGTTRPRQRARRGQATDPHSIAERLRRERIAERMKALQELVPNSNKTDKASMLDEIVDYVKFLQLQVKVLSMSRLGGAGAVAPLIADLPVEGQNNFIGAALGWNASSSSSPQDAMSLVERQVARLMEDDMGSALRFLQGRGLCLMPVSLATTISGTNSRSTGGVRALTVLDRSQVDASSSTAVGGCSNGGGDRDCFDAGSKPMLLKAVQNTTDKLQPFVAEHIYSTGVGLPLCATSPEN